MIHELLSECSYREEMLGCAVALAADRLSAGDREPIADRVGCWTQINRETAQHNVHLQDDADSLPSSQSETGGRLKGPDPQPRPHALQYAMCASEAIRRRDERFPQDLSSLHCALSCASPVDDCSDHGSAVDKRLVLGGLPCGRRRKEEKDVKRQTWPRLRLHRHVLHDPRCFEQRFSLSRQDAATWGH
eukprot:TRINITY_DN12585_c0_g1_i2.p1 TRINITY_DN12585_c0_g1~~TRINITY_DN12585_c0_g1_i2.p1  ORF type:complete len:201 (-),score=15.81 TRINITY_DN12585_c0_g1_i2:83-649(-)